MPAKHIETVETEKCVLEVVECECGFHVGIDATYLEQVNGVDIGCLSCSNLISVGAF